MKQAEILEKIYAAYGTDSGILLGITDKQVVNAIIGFTILQLATADLTEKSQDSNNPTYQFLADENRTLKNHWDIEAKYRKKAEESNRELVEVARECYGYFSAPNFTDRYGTADRLKKAIDNNNTK